MQKLEGSESRPSAVAVMADGSRIVSGGTGGTIIIWDADTGKPLHRFRNGKNELDHLLSIVFLGQTSLFATGSLDLGKIRIWDAKDGKLVKTLDDMDREVTGLAASPDGKLLAVGDTDHHVTIWDVDTGKRKRSIWAYEHSSVAAVAFMNAGKRLVTTSSGEIIDRKADSEVKVWKIE